MDNTRAIDNAIDNLQAEELTSRRIAKRIKIVESTPLDVINIEVRCLHGRGSFSFNTKPTADVIKSVLDRLRYELDVSYSAIDKKRQELSCVIESAKRVMSIKEAQIAGAPRYSADNSIADYDKVYKKLLRAVEEIKTHMITEEARGEQ